MLNRSTNERIVCVSYNDELAGWKSIESELKSQIAKSPALRFSSNLGTPIVCQLSNVKFLNEILLSPEQLLPTTDKGTEKSTKKDKSAYPSTDMTIDPYSGAHEKPFLRLYISKGDDYKTIKPKVADWLKNVGEHDEWLIVHISSKENSFFSRSIASSLRSDFMKGKIERVCAFRAFDTDRTTNLMDDVVAKIRDGIARSGQKMISEYSARMKALESQRNVQTFNFLSFFALKEGLALVYEALRAPSAALGIYDELELLFGQRKSESWRTHFPSFGGQALGDDSGSLLDFGKKPYRALLLSRELTEFDFRQYLFSRQCHLLFTLGAPAQVLSRGIKFISSFEEALLSNKFSKLFVDVWCFGAFMDLAEACKAANQSTANDPSINYVLGDAYHSAVSRLDSLGAEFDFLPPEGEFFVCSDSAVALEQTPEKDPAEDAESSSEDAEEQFATPLKSPSDVHRGITFGAAPTTDVVEESSTTTDLPATPSKLQLNGTLGKSAESVELVASSELPSYDPAPTPSPAPDALLGQDTTSHERTPSVAGMLGEDVLAERGVEALPVHLPKDYDAHDTDSPVSTIGLGESPGGPSIVILNASSDSTPRTTKEEGDVKPEDLEIGTPEQRTTFILPKSSSSPMFNLPNVPKPSASPPRLRKEIDPTLGHSRTKSRSSHRSTHSRNSSIGEDIVLDDIPSLEEDIKRIEDDDENDSDPEQSQTTSEFSTSRSIPTISEEANHENPPTHIYSSYPELQMAILEALKDETLRNQLGIALKLSEADAQLFAESSNGAVFAITYLQATGLIGDQANMQSFLDIVKKDIQLTKLETILRDYIHTHGSHNGDSHSTASSSVSSEVSTPQPPSTPSQVQHPPSSSTPTSTAPLFTFKRVVGTPEASSSTSSSPISVSKSNGNFSKANSETIAPVVSIPAHESAIIAPAPTDFFSSGTSKKKPHLHTLQLNQLADGMDGPTSLNVDGMTITHPSLSSALAEASSFDKLYKTIALKSNAAFTAVNRARGSVRVKNALGKLAFARGHYHEALKYFDDSLINVYVSEGWDRLLFSLYNKIADCYLKLGQLSEFTSTLLCLLSPRLRTFCTLEQRSKYQQEFQHQASKLATSLPVTVDTKSPLDKMLNVRVSIDSPTDKKPMTSIKTISSAHFAMGDTIVLHANINSAFPTPIQVDKFYLTFQAVNSKTHRTRSFNVGTPNLVIKPGSQTVTLNAHMTKGRWGLASYSVTIGKLSLGMRYYHPGPRESNAILHFAVTKSVLATKLSVAPPTCLLLGAKQFLKITIDTHEDSIKEAIITFSTDRDVIKIPDGPLKATLNSRSNESSQSPSTPSPSAPVDLSSATSTEKASATPSVSTAANGAETESVPSDALSQTVTHREVLAKNHVVALPDLAPHTSLSFYLPITASVSSLRDDGQLAALSRELFLDMAFRKLSNEKKMLAFVQPLKWISPLAFEHDVVGNNSTSFFTTTTAKNQSTVPIKILSHSVLTEGAMTVVQDYTSALSVDEVTLGPGESTNLLFALDAGLPHRSSRTSIGVGAGSDSDHEPELPSWMSVTMKTEISTDVGEETSALASYSYNIPFKVPVTRYKLEMSFSGSMVVAELSKLKVEFYLPASARSNSVSFAAFYRLNFDPSQWSVVGRTYGRIKPGSSEVELGLVPLTASANPPTISIEEGSDPRSKVLIPASELSIKYSPKTLMILPKKRVTSVCREIVEH